MAPLIKIYRTTGRRKKAYKNVLLIDDTVGRGATLNKVTKGLKQQKLCKGKITALSLTGSFKVFGVISEV